MHALLIADADASARESAARVAQSLGLRPVLCENGVDAIELFRATTPLIAVIDRLLPVVDGIQVCSRIRDSTAGQATALFLTGVGIDGRHAELIQRYQLTDVLEKPFSTNHLSRVLSPFAPAPAERGAPRTDSPPDADTLDLELFPLARLLADLVSDRRTGGVEWWKDGLRKTLFLADGALVGAISNSQRDDFRNWATRDPGLSPEARAWLSTVSDPGSAGWTAHVCATGALDEASFAASLARWVIHVTLELLTQRGGYAVFRPDREPAERASPIDARGLVFAGLRALQVAGFESLLPGPLTLVQRARTQQSLDCYGLTQIELELLTLCDGRHTLGDLHALTRLIQREVGPFLYGLIVFGLLEPVVDSGIFSPRELGRHPSSTELSSLAQGRLGSLRIYSFVSALSAGGRTGIVQLRNGDHHAAIHFQEGRLVFARSSMVEHRLGTVLLASGKISPEDHERAMTLHDAHVGRRLGTILVDIRALSLKELHDGLCTQVRLILQEAFSWRDGSFSFMDGDLPTIDMVSIDVSTPNLLLDCLRAHDEERMYSELPDGNDYLRALWKDESIRSLLRLQPSEAGVLQAARDGVQVSRLAEACGLSKEACGRALYALLGLGCVTTTVEPAAARVSAAAPDADTTAEAGLNRAALARANQQVRLLERRVAALELENKRLRGQLVSSDTVTVNA